MVALGTVSLSIFKLDRVSLEHRHYSISQLLAFCFIFSLQSHSNMSDISDENHCSYDCTAHPTTLTPYADISGVGVSHLIVFIAS